MSNRNSRKSGKNRRPQTPKVGNPRYVEGIQGLRRSGAAGIHKGQGEYDRNRKHKGQGYE
jgi:hypothetical protein